MPEPLLADHLASERSRACRSLLAYPLLDGDADPDAFRLVARHAPWLVEYFERTCGWALTVDPASRFARLAKRPAFVDVTRPLRRSRGAAAPFDRRRYQLLCLVCAALVRHPVTTVGLLAGSVAGDAGLETSRHAERAAFVDALRALIDWGVLEATAGDVETFVESERANALLSADTSRLHRLIVSPAAPSSLAEGLSAAAATGELLAEPRYGPVPGGAGDDERGDEARNRWARHRLGRRVLDDPAVHVEDLSDAERAYLASSSGRRWLRERIAEAGFDLEERAEGLVAVDPEAIATDIHFPAPLGNVHQLALLLADRMVGDVDGGRRALGRLSPAQLAGEVAAVMGRFPGWARSHRAEGGPERLGREAADLLVALGLARRDADGSLAARPALARYRTGEPVVARTLSLFPEIAL